MRLQAIIISAILATPAAAHFQEIIPSDDVMSNVGDVTLDLSFTHPFEGGPMMPIEKPVQVGMIHGDEVTDLTGQLEEVAGSQWSVTQTLNEPGTALFYVVPQPYWEPAEGKFIVHYAKSIVDVGPTGEGWDTEVGLPVEIMPLTRPSGIWAGNSFTGVVLQDGEPAPFAEIEVEFVNDGSIAAPNDAFITQVLKADANGTFTYAMPFAGWYGFAALIEGPDTMTSPDGNEVPVELGGLIWIKTTEAAE